MRSHSLNLFCLLLLFLGTTGIKAQSLVDDANISTGAGGNVFNESIKIISNSKKIFIITNNNQQLGQGDFISIALENKLAARALVAKVHQGQVGIKMLKIYSLTQWGKIKRDMEVQIVKGDDSNFGGGEVLQVETKTKIKDEEDLFTGDVVIEDELGEFENKNRNIKPDNVVSLHGGFYTAKEPNTVDGGDTVRAQEYGVAWAHQFADNYFAEGAYGRIMLNGFPAEGSQTLINHFMFRIKYNFKGPLYTFFMPYAGFHTFTVQSPDAGKTDDEITNEAQLEAVNKLKKSGPAFGVTVLRRLVPGWFIKADIGTDMMNIGFAIEF